MYIDFIDKCLSLLTKDGELVFVLPADFFRLTGTMPVLTRMCEVGAFTDIHWGESENLFEGATIDVAVVRFQKGRRAKGRCTEFPSGEKRFYRMDGGKFEFYSGAPSAGTRLGDIATVHVGLVSGREAIFKRDTPSSINILVGENERDRYLMPQGLGDPVVKEFLLPRKNDLMARRIRKFDESNWFEWGALRNLKLMKDRAGTKCVYIRCLTRSSRPAFAGEVEMFGSSLICVVPRGPSAGHLPLLVDFLNSSAFRDQHTRGGRFRVSQREVALARVPIGATQST